MADGRCSSPTCRKELSGQVVRALGGEYHADCFCCNRCGEIFMKTGNRDVYVTDDNELLCGDCKHDKAKCYGCWKLIQGGEPIVAAFGYRTYHKACVPAGGLSTDKTTVANCVICKLEIKEKAVNIPGGPGIMHHTCFCCCDCGKKFSDDEVPGTFMGKLMCMSCHTKKMSTLYDMCPQCDQEISSGSKFFMGTTWHRNCISCFKCKKDLLCEGRAQKGGKLYCDPPC